MLAALIPLFDSEMQVAAYSVFTQRHNYLLHPSLLGTAYNDGAVRIAGLELIEQIGLEKLTNGKEVFVPVNSISILGDIESQCSAPHEKIVLLLDNTIPPVSLYVTRIMQLKEAGYKIAIHKLAACEYESYAKILALVDYVLLNNRKLPIDTAKTYFDQFYPNAKLCAGNICDLELFTELKEEGYTLFEGKFYRLPVLSRDNKVTPLKFNYISLMNTVNDPEFDLQDAADIIGRDTALSISLLEMVNRMTTCSGVKTIRHAAAMLGQKELKKWINTAIGGKLCSDQPGAITRLSLLRARFAENVADSFGHGDEKDVVFLLGLMSVLDIVMEKPMVEALQMVTLDDDLKRALIDRKGPFANILDFVLQYEQANWQEVSRQMILNNLSVDTVYNAYIDALCWYRDMVQ